MFNLVKRKLVSIIPSPLQQMLLIDYTNKWSTIRV